MDETRTSALTQDDVRGIAEYARIGLDGEELPAMTRDLNSIIETLAPIAEYDLDGVEPTFHPIGGMANVMRDDVEEAGFTQDEAIANATTSEDGCFSIPPILGGKGGGA